MFSIFNNTECLPKTPIYDIKINALNGGELNLNYCKGKFILFINVASKCGFTSQYEELQELHDIHGNKLVIIGIPCNQFGRQEPGTKEDIINFCKVNYGVTFQITEKIDTKGKNQHPLYKWLTDKSINGVKNSNVKWNFQKYLISPEGYLIDYFISTTTPTSNKILKHLH